MSLRTDTASEQHSLLDLLEPADRAKVMAACTPRAYVFGDPIVRQGEPADAFFIIVAGRARVVQRLEDGEEIVLRTLQAGEVFGEIALLHGGVRTATVRASGDVTALRLDKDAFETLTAEVPGLRGWLERCARARLMYDFLKVSSVFRHLPAPVLREIIDALRPVEVPRGSAVFRRGDPVGPMFLVQEGRLRVTGGLEEGASRDLAFLREGDVFGEMSLLRNAPRGATVEAITDSKLLALDPPDFTVLEQRWPELRHAVDERLATYDYQREARVPLDFAAELLPAQAEAPPVLPGELSEAPSAGEPGGETRRGRRGRRLRRFPYMEQIDEADCGVACLAMICRYHGRRISLTRLRSLAHTATDGTTLRNLCAAADELGLAARPVRLSRRALVDLPRPAILHWGGDHWVVLVDVDEKRGRVRIADPAAGDRWLAREELDANWNGYAAQIDPTPEFTGAGDEPGSWAWMKPHVQPYLGTLARALGLALVGSGLMLVLPILTQVVVDRVVVEGAEDALTLVLAAMAATFGFRTISSLLQGYLLAFVAVRVDASVLDYLSRRLLALPLTYFLSRRTGDIQRRLDGARQIRQMIVSSGVQALLAAVQVAAAFLLMLVYSVKLGLLFLLATPVYGVLMVLAQRRLRPLYDELEASQGRYRSEQLDAIKGVEAVKASSAELAFRHGLLERFLAMARQQFRADLTVLSFQSAVEAAGFLTSMVFLWLGARAAMAGELTLGGFVAFNSLVALAVAPLGFFLNRWDDWQLIKVLGGRLQDVLMSEPEQGADHSRLLPVHALSGDIELRSLTFRYGGPESRPIVKDLTLKVPAGRTVAVVGRSGSGKTTLIKLLAGLLEPTSGSVLFDGVDLRTLNHHDLRAKMGFVLQESHIFSGTVLDNITLGLDRNLERAVAAARAANAHDFIERLPLGYETRIGESGLGLSGGQRQRVAIARAIYRNPVILVFDEATSALDAESERAIQENMASLFKGRTVFVIAHRLSTIRDADWTIVLEQGEIVEQGTHQDLMDRRGIYFYLVSRQVEG